MRSIFWAICFCWLCLGQRVGVSTWEWRELLCSSSFHSSVFMGEDASSSAQSLSFACLLPPAASLLSGHAHNRFPTWILAEITCLASVLVSLLPQPSFSVRTNYSHWFFADQSFPFFLSPVFLHAYKRQEYLRLVMIREGTELGALGTTMDMGG